MTIGPQLLNKSGNLAQIEEEKLEIGGLGSANNRDRSKELENLKDISDTIASLESDKSSIPMQSNK